MVRNLVGTWLQHQVYNICNQQVVEMKLYVDYRLPSVAIFQQFSTLWEGRLCSLGPFVRSLFHYPKKVPEAQTFKDVRPREA